MQPPPSESVRSPSLAVKRLIDSAPEPEFDDLACAAASLTERPIATIGFVDGERVYLKAERGLLRRELPLAGSFFEAPLLSGASFIVEDAREDARFAGNPLVAGPPFVRSYAGACLHDEHGVAFGCSCVMHTRPGSLTAQQLEGLNALGRSVTPLVELRTLRDTRLLKSEALLISAQRISGIGCWQWDLVNDEITWSDEMYTIFGLPRTFAPSLSAFNDRLHPDDRAIVAERTKVTIEQGMTDFPDYRIVRPGGEVRIVQASAELEKDRTGKPLCLTGALLDVTDRRRDEQERTELTLKVMQAQKLESLGLLAAGVAHDFNNLLVGILGNAELAAGDVDLKDETRVLIERVVDASVRAASLTRQLLAYTGRGHLHMVDVDLSLQVAAIAELLRASIAKSVTLSLQLSRDLPAIRADADQLQQVTMNLIVNAAEACGDAQGQVTVSTFLHDVHAESQHDLTAPTPLSPGRYVVFEVSDHGKGMDIAMLDRIFEPFFTTKFTGRGLGLAAVLGIARSHRAVLTVDSTPGSGTTFRVHFPALDHVASTTDRKKSVPPPSDALAGRTILVVDDEAHVRNVERTALEELGAQVLEAENGDAGIAMLASHHGEVDALLLDLVMPGLDPVSTLRALRAIRPELPVLVQSGYSEEEAETRLRAFDSRLEFLQKPFSPATLIAKLGKLLTR